MAIGKTYKSVMSFIHDEGYDQAYISKDMIDSISLWNCWYKGYVPKFHDYQIYNGRKSLIKTRRSLNLGKKIPEDWANLLFNEKCAIVIDHAATSKFVMEVLDLNDFEVRINEYQERKCALGTVCYIPYAVDVDHGENGEILGSGNIKMNYVTANNIIPLSWENGTINEIAIKSSETIEGSDFVYIQLFVKNNKNEYEIRNRLLKVKKNGESISYEHVTFPNNGRFSKVADTVYMESTMKPFIIDRPNIANTIDEDSPLGVSVFANAIPTMETADIIFDSMGNEFILGRKKIYVTDEMIKITDENPSFDPMNSVYNFVQRKPGENSDPIIESNMSLRTAEHGDAIQFILNILSSQVGFGENHYRFDSGGVSTATQVISENNTMFRTLKKHEKTLESALYDLIRLIIHIGKNKLGLTELDEGTNITINFDDSIIEDTGSEKERALREVNADIISRVEYRMEYKGETREEAELRIKEIDSGISIDDDDMGDDI